MRLLVVSLLLSSAPPLAAQQGNILVLVADDLGIDQLACYGVGSDLPVTPTIEALAAAGLRFENAWSAPECSPARAEILTGRHGFRTGIGGTISPGTHALPLAEITLPEMLALGGACDSSAAIGKWHLGDDGSVGFQLAPNLQGFGHFDGTMYNLTVPGADYYTWPRVIDGVSSTCVTYATTQQVDSTLEWLATAPEPWFCMVNFSAPHLPLHTPPAGLYTEDLSGLDVNETPRPFYKAAIEALDSELGRLLAGLGDAEERTTIFFLGDNGTPQTLIVPPFVPAHGKGTVYDGGVHVPLLVVGPAVAHPGTSVSDPVVMTDLFATVAELAGVDLASALPAGLVLDSTSFADVIAGAGPGARASSFAEFFRPNGLPVTSAMRCFQELGHHLLRFPDHDELYELAADPFELSDLLLAGLDPSQQLVYDRLSHGLDGVLGNCTGAPAVTFGAYPTQGLPGISVPFYDLTCGAVDAWTWDFGDGEQAFEPNPTHVYLHPGTYDVTLTVDGPAGSATATLPAFVQIDGIAADSSVRNGSGTNPLVYSALTPPILGASWDTRVDVSARPTTALVYQFGYEAPLAGLGFAFGELLIDPTSAFALFTSTPPFEGAAVFQNVVQSDASLSGRTVATQCVLVGGGLQLTNALDLVLGY